MLRVSASPQRSNSPDDATGDLSCLVRQGSRRTIERSRVELVWPLFLVRSIFLVRVIFFPYPRPSRVTLQESSHKITKHKSIPAFRLGMMMRVSVRVTLHSSTW